MLFSCSVYLTFGLQNFDHSLFLVSQRIFTIAISCANNEITSASTAVISLCNRYYHLVELQFEKAFSGHNVSDVDLKVKVIINACATRVNDKLKSR